MFVTSLCLLVLTFSGHIQAQRVQLRESDPVMQFADKYSHHLLDRYQDSRDEQFAHELAIDDESTDSYAAENVAAVREKSELGPEQTEILTNITDRAIRTNFPRSTNGNIIYLYARNIAEFLQIVNILTSTSDVDNLVNEIIKYEERAVDNTTYQDNGLKSDVERASAGFQDFVVSRGLTEKEQYGVLTVLYANHFYRIKTVDDADSDVVKRFADMYSDKIDEFRYSFNPRDLTAKQVAKLNGRLVRMYSSGDDYTKVLVPMIRRAILKNYDKTTTESILSLFGTTIGEYFQLFGAIDKDTTDDRLQQLVDKIVQAQKDEIGDATDSRTVLRRATRGFQKYLMGMDSNGKEKYPALVTLYANNFYRLP